MCLLEHTDWIGAITAFAALCAALIAGLSLRQLKDQTSASYKPHLVLEEAWALIKGLDGNGATLFPAKWVRHFLPPHGIVGAESPTAKPLFPLALYNVGLGAAASVEFEWQFDLDTHIARVNARMGALPEDQRISALIRDDTFLMNPDGANAKMSFWGMRLQSDLKSQIHALLPTSQKSDPFELDLPSSYVLLASGYLHTAIPGNSKNEIEVPSIDLLVRYQDIGRIAHSTKFHIEPIISISADRFWAVRFAVSVVDMGKSKY
ncbi:MAG: hypothetical protein WBB32_09530 [Flavobacteriales bacterium]